MKKLFVSAAFAVLSATAMAQARVEVTVKNIRDLSGTIRMAVYSGEDSFLQKELLSKDVKVAGNEVIFIFENVKTGEYAISTYHDVDDNNELDTGFMGMPKEPYGFSNDARGTFGPPTYEKAKFKVTGDTMISIKVQ